MVKPVFEISFGSRFAKAGEQRPYTHIIRFFIYAGAILVPSRYLRVFWGERRLGIKLRRAGSHGKGRRKDSYFSSSSSSFFLFIINQSFARRASPAFSFVLFYTLSDV